MSGGYFDYRQHSIEDIIEDMELLISGNGLVDGYHYCRDYQYQVLEAFEKAVKALKVAQIYANRIDWLVSGDDGEDDFIRRLEEELVKVNYSSSDTLTDKG